MPDFWGIVFPAYLGALGAILASGVAVVALIRDIRTRRGLGVVAAVSNDLQQDQTPQIAYPARAPAGTSSLELLRDGNTTILRNISDAAIVIEDLDVPSGGKVITLRQSLPATIEAGEGFGFTVHSLLSGPAIAALEVRWRAADGTQRQSRFFV